MSTIQDIAKHANVSIKTVSRVLANDPAVKEKTRKAVEATMDVLGYRPRHKANSVGILLDEAASGYLSRVHEAALTACMETNNFLVVELIDVAQKDLKSRIETLIKGTGISDLILFPPLCNYGPLKDFLKSAGVNCVLISPAAPDQNFSSVSMDDKLAAREITEYLIKLGHTVIAHIAGDSDNHTSTLRRMGFYEAFDTQHIKRPEAHYIIQGSYDFKAGLEAEAAMAFNTCTTAFNYRAGLEAAQTLLTLEVQPTAIFAANDEMAAGIYATAHKLGLRVPKDLSVVGFDDAPTAASLWPTLTTVAQPYLEMVRQAIKILKSSSKKIQPKNTVVNYVLPHTIVFRESAAEVSGSKMADGVERRAKSLKVATGISMP